MIEPPPRKIHIEDRSRKGHAMCNIPLSKNITITKDHASGTCGFCLNLLHKGKNW